MNQFIDLRAKLSYDTYTNTWSMLLWIPRLMDQVFSDLVFVSSLSVCLKRENYREIIRCNQNVCTELIKIMEDCDYFYNG